MGLKQRENEETVLRIQRHWTANIPSQLWWIVLIFLTLIFFELGWYGTTLIFLALCAVPVIYCYFQNQATCFQLTNQRLYVEQGLFSKSKLDIPLEHVRDVLLRQSPIQRLVKAGDLEITTGNEYVRRLKDVHEAEEVQKALQTHLAG
jgi:uncharacterized membrane protein YdbT with pleckstrin-like domain